MTVAKFGNQNALAGITLRERDGLIDRDRVAFNSFIIEGSILKMNVSFVAVLIHLPYQIKESSISRRMITV